MPPEEKPSEEALNFFKTMKGNVEVIDPPTDPITDPPIPPIEPPITNPLDELELTRPQAKKQAKATPEESLSALRKQRDTLDTNLKVFKETFGDNPPQVIKPLFDYVSEIAEGPITENVVTEFINKFKSQEEEIKKLREDLGEKEKIVTEVDIRYSDEFRNDFDIPYKEAAQSLFLEFANVDGDNVLAPIATKKLNDFLLGKPDATAFEVKSQLNAFVKEYKEETGEEPIVPSVTSLMGSLRGFKDKAVKLKNAYDNWSETKKIKQTEKLTQSQAQKEQQDKALVKQRKDLAQKAYREFDLEGIPFVEEKDIEDLVREEYQFGEDIRGGKVPPYNEFIERGVKVRLWDKYASRLAELIEFEEKYNEGERNNLTGENRLSKAGVKDNADWLTMRR